MDALLDTSILSWNIRGAQNNNARRQLKDLLRKYNPTYLAIYETHTPHANLASFWNHNNYNPVHIVEANDHSRGIRLLTHTAANTTSTVIDHNQYSISFTINRGNAVIFCTCVYTSPNPTMRASFWNHLSSISRSITSPWMLIGDFNETLLPSDQRGGIFQHNRAILFSTFMDNCDLLDITATGGRFTWHRNNNGIRILSKKLDCGLANVDWRMSFSKAFVEILCRLYSDHNLLLLRFGGLPLTRGPRPFRFDKKLLELN